MTNQGGYSHPDRITLKTRIYWRQVALEEALDRLASDRSRSPVFVESVLSRYGELLALREVQQQGAA